MNFPNNGNKSKDSKAKFKESEQDSTEKLKNSEFKSEVDSEKSKQNSNKNSKTSKSKKLKCLKNVLQGTKIVLTSVVELAVLSSPLWK